MVASAADTKGNAPIVYGGLQFRGDAPIGAQDTISGFTPYFKRLRLGLKGKIESLPVCYDIMLHSDCLGKDDGTKYDSIKIAVWHAFATVKLMPDNESLNLTVGEYLPQLSRECATSLFTLTSIEKGTSASYLRKFLLGKTNGIQPGMMLGGLLNTPMPVLYHVGCQFYPNYQNLKYKGSLPLFTGRTTLMVVGQEVSKYKMLFAGVEHGRKPFVSLGVMGAVSPAFHQKPGMFAVGVDIAAATGSLSFSAENSYYGFNQKNGYKSITGVAHLANAFSVGKNRVVEPAVSYWWYRTLNTQVKQYTGTDGEWGAGVNYYISAHNLKFQLYYNNRNASGDNMALIGNKKITTNGGSVSALVQLMF